MYADKASILAGLRPREKDEDSPIFGKVRLRELTRLQWRNAGTLSLLDDGRTDLDWWDTETLAVGMIDPASPLDAREALFTGEELRDLANRKEVWEEIRRLADLIRTFSEVGGEALTKSDPPADTGLAA
jgi:hypothetical protein